MGELKQLSCLDINYLRYQKHFLDFKKNEEKGVCLL